MNKIILGLVLGTVLTFGFAACSSNNTPSAYEQINAEQLPENTKQFLSNVFPSASFFRTSKTTKTNYYGSCYKVLLDNKVEIDFDKQGNWTEIEREDQGEIPAEFLTQEVPLIYAYVQAHYKGKHIVEINKDRRGYEVTLNDEIELVFNEKQAFISVDLDLDANEELIVFEKLPSSAQVFLTTYFSTSNPVRIKKEADKSGDEYTVSLADGFKIEFNATGDWTAVESTQLNVIPTGFMPPLLISYTQTQYPEYRLTSIEKKRKTLEVELEKGKEEIELLFDDQGHFLSLEK